MDPITVDKAGNKTTIYRRQNGITWLFCIPHLMLLCFEIAVPIVAAYWLIVDLHTHQPVHSGLPIAGILFAAKATWYGNFLYKVLAARSILVVQGDTLHIISGQIGRLTDYGTYSASALSDLDLQSGKNLVLPAGKVQAQVGDVPVMLANYISDSDGSHLIDVLCDAYPFSTPDTAPSPAVTNWS